MSRSNIWYRFIEFVNEQIGYTTQEVDINVLSNSLFANLIFNNLDQINIEKHDKMSKATDAFHIIFYSNHQLTNMVSDVKSSGYQIQAISKANIVKVKGKPRHKLTAYEVDLGYNRKSYYLPHERTIITNALPVLFLTKEDVVMTHLVNQSDDKLIITEETLRFVERHDTSKMLTRRILTNSLAVQAQSANKSAIQLNLKKIDKKRRDIEVMKADIITLEKVVANLEEEVIFQKGGETIANELMDLAERYKSIDYITAETTQTGINIIVRTHPVEFIRYDKDRLKRYLNNGGWNNNTSFRRILQLFVEGKCKIFFGRYDIKLTLSNVSGTQKLSYSFNALDKYKNPHESITCIGTYRTTIDQLTKANKYDLLLINLLEYLQSITFGDGGASNLPAYCYALNEEGEKIYG